MQTSSALLRSYWQPTVACVGAIVVAIATLNEGEHSWWNLLGASLVSIGALAIAIDQVRIGRDLRNAITGGSSFVFFEFVPIKGKKAHYYVCARQSGEETVRDLTAAIIDVVQMTKTPPGPHPHIQPSFQIPNMVPGSRQIVNEILVPEGQELRFQVTFQATNGTWMQTVIASPGLDGHSFALRVWKLDVGRDVPTMRTLHEQIDAAFPRKADAGVDWSLGSVTLSEEAAEHMNRLQGHT
jgi:hypothetical protein